MFFHPMDWLIFLAFGLVMWAQFKVKGNFATWSRVAATSGFSGQEVARNILDANGLYDVPVEVVPGQLSDHYDPTKRVVRLSEEVYYGTSIASVSVAAHEVGHAVQHKEKYGFLTMRHSMFPLVNLTSGVAPFLLLGGFFFQATSLIGIGIIFFSFAVAFQLITLPVEFDASSRAKRMMLDMGIISDSDKRGVNKVLGAAALTYVAATLMALLELLKYILIFTSSNDD
ncbi:MAG: zinc metallopeptidase [Bacilli bacterium]